MEAQHMSDEIRQATGRIPDVRLAVGLATLLVLGPASSARAQTAPPGREQHPSISGKVIDRRGRPISQVTVRIAEPPQRTTTGEDGRYVFEHLPAATYRVSFSRIGFHSAEQTIAVSDRDTVLDAVMSEMPLELAPIAVAAPSEPSRLLSVAQPVEILADSDVYLAGAPNLGQAVESASGVRNMGTGNGIGKPVIRGLRSDRVVVASDGFRLETQQWEDDEGPTVPTADADRIEVIRGPASVLYGSDALGGVINVVPSPLPTARDRSPFVAGELNGSLAGNGNAGEGRVSVEAARQSLGFRGTFQLRNQGDLDTPEGELPNSGLRALVGTGAVGAQGDWGMWTTTYSHYSDRAEINPDPTEVDATPFSRNDDDVARVTFARLLRTLRLDVALGAERNQRREYASWNDPVDSVANGKLDQRVSGEFRLQPASPGLTHGILGLAISHDHFTRFGEQNQAPDSRQADLGAFFLEQAASGRWHWLAGGRYDHRSLHIEADTALSVSAQTRRYDAFTGTIGTLVRVGGAGALAFNLGSGFRAPNITELFTRGTDEGTQTVLIGNPELHAEHSIEVDAGLRAQSATARGSLDLYWNGVRDFVYPRHTGAVDPSTQLPIVVFVQGDARLKGVELSSSVDLGQHWEIQSVADYMRGDNITTHTPLPWIPPLRFTAEVRWTGGAPGIQGRPYLELGTEADARQTRLDPNDIPTAGYAIARLEAGSGLSVAGHRATLELQITNLFDRHYVSFLDIHKSYAIAPGRNVILRLSTALGSRP